MITPILLIITLAAAKRSVDKSCNHPIFCNNDILQAAADSNLFQDSKTFVDLTLKAPVDEVLKNFKTQAPKQFIQSNFDMNPDLLLVNTTFSDYKDDPQILSKIEDPEMKRFGAQLNKRWNLLGKKVDFSRASLVGTCQQNCSSYLPMVNNLTMLVPGGRFRESYYWDTYWIILGLIASDMLNTAQMLLNNFAQVIHIYGFIPNGLRVYYLNRSQPPFFFMMVKAVVQALREKGLIGRAGLLQKKMLNFIKLEHQYWDKTHSLTIFIKGNAYDVSQYRADTTSPRPESFKEDMATASKIIDPRERARLFMCISSMAESGWDFSSRWLEGEQLVSTVIDKLIPTDLNTLLGMMEHYIAHLSLKHKLQRPYFDYISRYHVRSNYLEAIKYNDRFPDFHLQSSSIRPDIPYPSDFTPYMLFRETSSLKDIYHKLVNAQASSLQTGQQWDAPNVWAPNNWIINQVSPSDEAKAYAVEWVQTTYCGWVKYGNLFQKYNSNILGERGEGGEYKPQVGFGWTNGLALHYLSLYPDIKAPVC